MDKKYGNISTEQIKGEGNEMVQQKKECQDKCTFKYMRRDIGVCRFLNTGEPYIIEQCLTCKREYVRELSRWNK